MTSNREHDHWGPLRAGNRDDGLHLAVANLQPTGHDHLDFAEGIPMALQDGQHLVVRSFGTKCHPLDGLCLKQRIPELVQRHLFTGLAVACNACVEYLDPVERHLDIHHVVLGWMHIDDIIAGRFRTNVGPL